MWSHVKSLTARALGWVAIFVFLVLVLDVLWGVFTRKILSDQAFWTEELARFLLVWISFLGAAIAYLDEKHLGVDLLFTSLEPSAQRVCKIFSHATVLAFSLVVLGIGGTSLVIDRFNANQTLPALEIPKAWQYLVVPISGYVISLFALGNIISLTLGTKTAGQQTEEEVAP